MIKLIFQKTQKIRFYMFQENIIIKYIIEALNAYMKAFAGEQDFKDIDEKQLNVI